MDWNGCPPWTGTGVHHGLERVSTMDWNDRGLRARRGSLSRYDQLPPGTSGCPTPATGRSGHGPAEAECAQDTRDPQTEVHGGPRASCDRAQLPGLAHHGEADAGGGGGRCPELAPAAGPLRHSSGAVAVRGPSGRRRGGGLAGGLGAGGAGAEEEEARDAASALGGVPAGSPRRLWLQPLVRAVRGMER